MQFRLMIPIDSARSINKQPSFITSLLLDDNKMKMAMKPEKREKEIR